MPGAFITIVTICVWVSVVSGHGCSPLPTQAPVAAPPPTFVHKDAPESHSHLAVPAAQVAVPVVAGRTNDTCGDEMLDVHVCVVASTIDILPLAPTLPVVVNDTKTGVAWPTGLLATGSQRITPYNVPPTTGVV